MAVLPDLYQIYRPCVEILIFTATWTHKFTVNTCQPHILLPTEAWRGKWEIKKKKRSDPNDFSLVFVTSCRLIHFFFIHNENKAWRCNLTDGKNHHQIKNRKSFRPDLLQQIKGPSCFLSSGLCVSFNTHWNRTAAVYDHVCFLSVLRRRPWWRHIERDDVGETEETSADVIVCLCQCDINEQNKLFTKTMYSI